MNPGKVMHKTRHETLADVIAHLGGRPALHQYMEASSLETSALPPGRPGEVLGDFRSHGGIIVIGFEDGKWWDTDAVTPMHGPSRWAPLPPGLQWRA